MDKHFPQGLPSADHRTQSAARGCSAMCPTPDTGVYRRVSVDKASRCYASANLIRPPMFTGLSTAAGPVVHIGARSGACLIAAFVRTSTGQGTRRRGNPGETPDIKRTGPALRPGAIGRSSDRNVRQAGSRLQSSTVFGSTRNERTGSGSTDDADAMPWDAQDQERDRTQPTALSGSLETALTPRS